MALFYECMLKCARKLLDTADIVRDAIFTADCPTKTGRLSVCALDNGRCLRQL